MPSLQRGDPQRRPVLCLLWRASGSRVDSASPAAPPPTTAAPMAAFSNPSAIRSPYNREVPAPPPGAPRPVGGTAVGGRGRRNPPKGEAPPRGGGEPEPGNGPGGGGGGTQRGGGKGRGGGGKREEKRGGGGVKGGVGGKRGRPRGPVAAGWGVRGGGFAVRAGVVGTPSRQGRRCRGPTTGAPCGPIAHQVRRQDAVNADLRSLGHTVLRSVIDGENPHPLWRRPPAAGALAFDLETFTVFFMLWSGLISFTARAHLDDGANSQRQVWRLTSSPCHWTKPSGA